MTPVHPRLSYGRHRGPFAPGSRRAAVLVAMMPPPGSTADSWAKNQTLDDWRGWTIPLIRRPKSMRHHAGQIALPGGQIETNESSRDAAVREFTEELGVKPTVCDWFGELPSQHVFASGHRLDAHAAVIDTVERFVPQAGEVDSIHLISVDRLHQPHSIQMIQRRRIHHRDDSLGWTFRVPSFKFDGIEIWGVTAMILFDLVRMLHSRER